jgi:predicted site-specific integrase-resolvase
MSPLATNAQKHILNTAAAATFIGVSKKTLLKYCRNRQITFMIYPDGSYRFRQSALDIWLQSRTFAAKVAA